MIEFRGVTKRFPDGTVAVDDLDLTVDDGKITVFVGPSGCGKTTSLRMVNRMIEPTAGTITVDGQDIMSVDAAELRRGIGYVIQQAGLFPHRTILDNIATVPLLLGWGKAKARARASRADGHRRAGPRRWASATRRSCPAGSSSGSGWPARWPRTRRSC